MHVRFCLTLLHVICMLLLLLLLMLLLYHHRLLRMNQHINTIQIDPQTEL